MALDSHFLFLDDTHPIVLKIACNSVLTQIIKVEYNVSAVDNCG